MMIFTACVSSEKGASNINEKNINQETGSEVKKDKNLILDSNEEDLSSNDNINETINIDSVIVNLKNERGYYQDLVHVPAIDEVLFQIGMPITEDKLKSIEDQEIRSKLKEILSQGFKITDEQEYFGVQIDYEKLMKLSVNNKGPGRDFIELNYYFDEFDYRITRNEPVNMDEMVSMIIRIEDHFTKWPGSKYNSELNKLYKNQLLFYFLGSDSYEVFDYETNKMYASRYELIKKHLQLYTKSELAQIGMQYLLTLESHEHSYHPVYIQIINNFKRFGLESDLELSEVKLLDNSKSVFLPEISGHTNYTIQESINQILKNEVDNIMKSTGFSPTSDGTFYFNTYIYTANPQTLSIECMGSHNLKDWTLDKTASSTLTFNLNTGEPMRLEGYFDQDLKKLENWLLPVINDEFNKYFGEYAMLSSLDGVQYLVLEDALLIIGTDPTHRAYIPRWILKDYVDVETIFK